MLASIFHLKLATTAMASWMAAATPIPLPGAAIALALESHVASPVEVDIFDENRNVSSHFVLERDGSADAATTAQVAHVFRCRTDREHAIARHTLAMLADLAERYGKPIELVSGFRVQPGESLTSPHRDARAIDFRIRGVSLPEIRDYLFRTYTSVGVGWYPDERFIHMDSRPQNTYWTFTHDARRIGTNNYHPFWAEPSRAPAVRRRPGV
jgi:uncharacterized protein YcbK (DUF882 family)